MSLCFGQSSQPENFVLQQDVFSSRFGVCFGRRGLDKDSFEVSDPFVSLQFDWKGREPVVTIGQIQAELQQLITLIAR